MRSRRSGGGWGAYRSVLRNKAFLVYFGGTSISDLGNFAALAGFLFVVYDLTHSRTRTTGVGIAETLPYLIFGLIGGVVADRTRRARTNAIADTIRGIVEVAVFAWYLISGLPVVGAYVAIFVLQLCGCVANPSRRALVPELVSADELTAANGLVGNSNYVVSILGPVVAVGLLALGGIGTFFAFDAATYLVSAVSMWILSRWLGEHRLDKISARATADHINLPSIWRDLIDLAKVVTGSRQLIAMFCLSGLLILINTWPWQIGIVIKASDLGGSGARNYTVIMAVFAVAIVLAGLVIARLFKALNLGHSFAGAIVWGAGLAGVGLVHSRAMVCLMAAVIGLGLSGVLQSRLYILQTGPPSEMLGRAYSLYSLIAYGANFLGLVIFGVIGATGFSLDRIFAYSGSSMTAVGASGLVIWLAARLWRRTASRRLANHELSASGGTPDVPGTQNT